VSNIVKINDTDFGGEVKRTVDGRDLRAALAVRKDYSNWMKAQIKRARLVENRDYITFAQKGVGGQFDSTEYHLTIEAGKHIAMMSGTDKGFEVREYFIECERVAKQRVQPINLDDPAALRAALLNYTEKVQVLETTVKHQAPKVEFADALLNADGTTLVRDVAKTIGVRVRPLERALRDKGVILPNNAPAAQYVTKGYFKEDTHPYETKTRGTQISHTARVTGKGIEFIRRFVRRHAGLFGQQTGAA
jgi:anti-repressor protein